MAPTFKWRIDVDFALDDIGRYGEIRRRIAGKPALHAFYLDSYAKYGACLERCPPVGTVLEIGSGAGFAKEVVPGLVTSDFLPYPGVDRVVDACNMPFAHASLRAIFLLNTFHHIPDVGRFLEEAERCLVPGGRLFIIDHHPGILGYPIYRFFHHEPFAPKASSWEFASRGPLSGANVALAWIVFQRDRERFERRFPGLRLLRYEPTSPLVYWLAGGLKRWTLLPARGLPCVKWVEKVLLRISKHFGTYVDIEVERTA